MAQSTMSRLRKMAGKSPEAARFFWSGGPIDPAERSRSYLGGVTGFETDGGLVLVDSGLRQLRPRACAMGGGSRPRRRRRCTANF